MSADITVLASEPEFGLESQHRCVVQTSEELAALDARSYAMVARARIANAICYDETITTTAVRHLQDAQDEIARALRIVSSHDPDIL